MSLPRKYISRFDVLKAWADFPLLHPPTWSIGNEWGTILIPRDPKQEVRIMDDPDRMAQHEVDLKEIWFAVVNLPYNPAIYAEGGTPPNICT